MCCEQLLCARCARPVVEARCPVCREARAHVHAGAGVPVAAIVAALALVLALALLISSHVAG